jgi:hypothetical protein
VSVAASFASVIQTRESLLDVLFIGPQAYRFTMGRGLAHAEQMLEILASVNVCTEKPFSALEDLVVDHTAEVSGCICILTGWDQGRRDFIERLKVWGMEMLVLVIVEPGEAEKLEAGPLADCPGAFKALEVGRIEEGLAGLNLK